MSAKRKRPTWDEYFMDIVESVSKRGTCDRGYNAAVIVKDNRILATGYVGSPSGIEHCDDIGHEMHEVINFDGTTSKHCVRTAHAEQNAIAQAARHGVPIDGSTLYTKLEPCYTCAKMMINAGIKRVVCQKKYHRAQRTRDIFEKAELEVVILQDEVMEYENQR